MLKSSDLDDVTCGIDMIKVRILQVLKRTIKDLTEVNLGEI